MPHSVTACIAAIGNLAVHHLPTERAPRRSAAKLRPGWPVIAITGIVAVDAGRWVGRIADWAVTLMERLGAPGAGLAIGLENLFPPLPSEVILPLAGFAASRGDLSLVGAIAWTTAGSVVGAIILYVFGRIVGPDRVRDMVTRLPLIHLGDLDRAEAWFARHGRLTVLIGRMIPIVRSLVSIPAGVQRMPITAFLALTGLGSLLWNSMFIGAGYLLGENYVLVERYAGLLSRGLLILAAGAVVFLAGLRLVRSSQR